MGATSDPPTSAVATPCGSDEALGHHPVLGDDPRVLPVDVDLLADSIISWLFSASAIGCMTVAISGCCLANSSRITTHTLYWGKKISPKLQVPLAIEE